MICDPLWKESLVNSKIIEESTFGCFKTILIKSDFPTGRLYYPYRMFFFENDFEPVLAVNLENLGDPETIFLGVHGARHTNYGTVDPDLPIAEFKEKALSLAQKHICPPTKSGVKGNRSAKDMLQEINSLFSDDDENNFDTE